MGGEEVADVGAGVVRSAAMSANGAEVGPNDRASGEGADEAAVAGVDVAEAGMEVAVSKADGPSVPTVLLLVFVGVGEAAMVGASEVEARMEVGERDADGPRVVDGAGVATADGPVVAAADDPGVATADGPRVLAADDPGVAAADGPGVATADGLEVVPADGLEVAIADGPGVATADGPGAATVVVSNNTAAKSMPLLACPHEPMVLPTRSIVPSDPAARPSKMSVSVVPPCQVPPAKGRTYIRHHRMCG